MDPTIGRLRCWNRYRHTLAMAYSAQGKGFRDTWETIPNVDMQNASAEEIAFAMLPGIRARLTELSLDSTLLSAPQFRRVSWGGHETIWPLINEQGLEWYADSPLGSFDFYTETEFGLLENAQFIYDLGGHHGIWALYYSHMVGPTGRVYSFEPSLINVEVSALLFLLNDVSNVVNIAAAVGSQVRRRNASSRMLIDFVRKNKVQVFGIGEHCWEYADFLKMDVEGYEYELLTENPWLFDIATHFHIELHIPHLKNRRLDYRKVLQAIPFERFDVCNFRPEQPVQADSELSGFCSLMMKRKPAYQSVSDAA